MSDLFLSWLGSLLFSQSGVFFFLCLYSCLFFLPGLQRPSTYKRLTRCWSFHAVWWWTLCTSAVQWRDEDFIWFKSFNSKPNQANYYNASVALRFELWKNIFTYKCQLLQDHLIQRCTTRGRGPDLAPGRVISSRRSRLKNTRNFPEWWRFYEWS